MLYVHTRGWSVIELAVADKPPPHLHLAQCSAEIEFRLLTPLKAEFKVVDLRSVQATFAGAPPRAMCDLLVNGQPMRLQADDRGCLALHLPLTADVTLDFTAARYASRR
jgi:hypothetical protein